MMETSQIIQILTELALTKDPMKVLDKHFKSDDPNINSNITVDDCINRIYDSFLLKLKEKINNPVFFSEQEQNQMLDEAEAQFSKSLQDTKNGLNDAISRNYDIQKYTDFMICVTDIALRR